MYGFLKRLRKVFLGFCQGHRHVGGKGVIILSVSSLPASVFVLLPDEPLLSVLNDFRIDLYESGGVRQKSDGVGRESNIWRTVAPVAEAPGWLTIIQEPVVSEVKVSIGSRL